MEVELTDIFDWRFDQNADKDASGNYITENDYLGYKAVGWYDTFYTEMFNGYDYYDPATPKEVTIQYIADLEFWDGNPDTAIEVYAELQMREVEVTYYMSGFEDSHPFQTVVTMSWFDAPVSISPVWQGNQLGDFSDDYGDPLDGTMTCGFIIMDLLFYGADTSQLSIYVSFVPFEYTVHFSFPNGVQEDKQMTYDSKIILVYDGQGFDYAGYDFVGWFTEENGGGTQVADGTEYSVLEPNDQQTEITLHAYFVPSAGTSSSPAEGADDIANSTGGNGNGTIMGPAGSDDVTDELPGNVSLVVDDVLSSVRLPQLVGTSTIGVVEDSRALTGAEAMVATYAAPAVVYEVAGESQSLRTGAGNVTTVSRTATNNSYGTNAAQASVLSAITDSILTEASQVRIATPVADQISASVHAANAGVASLTGTVCSGSSVPAFPTSIATSMAPVAVVPATTRREA